jgi:hypothetical protein
MEVIDAAINYIDHPNIDEAESPGSFVFQLNILSIEFNFL